MKLQEGGRCYEKEIAILGASRYYTDPGAHSQWGRLQLCPARIRRFHRTLSPVVFLFQSDALWICKLCAFDHRYTILFCFASGIDLLHNRQKPCSVTSQKYTPYMRCDLLVPAVPWDPFFSLVGALITVSLLAELFLIHAFFGKQAADE